MFGSRFSKPWNLYNTDGDLFHQCELVWISGSSFAEGCRSLWLLLSQAQASLRVGGQGKIYSVAARSC
jgi:hypothetical protein